MALEIEHKFLVVNDEWRTDVFKSIKLRQGYLNNDTKRGSIRVRTASDQAWLNIKSATIGAQRQEFEYGIPLSDADEILEFMALKPLIEKTRYLVKVAEHTWEIDVFEGDNQGLIVAEVELERLGESFEIPAWVGKEVTDDARYYNTSLSTHPYKDW